MGKFRKSSSSYRRALNSDWENYLKRRLEAQETNPPCTNTANDNDEISANAGDSENDIDQNLPGQSTSSQGSEEPRNDTSTTAQLGNPLGLRFSRFSQQPRSRSRNISPLKFSERTPNNDENKIYTQDENKNMEVQSASKYKSKSFDPTEPKYETIFDNQGLNHFINPTVYTLKKASQSHYIRSFTDFMFYRKKKKGTVKFPSGVVHEAEAHGETAGKDREVKKSEKPPRRIRRVAKIYQDDGMDLGLGDHTCDPEDDALLSPRCCMHTCFKSNKMDAGKGDPAAGDQENAVTKDYKKALDKYAVYLDIAENFLSENLGTIKFGQNLFSIPMTYRRPEANDVNMLAAEVWLFAFGVHHLFHVTEDGAPDDDVPSKAEFEELLTCFADLALAADRISKRAVLYAVSHSTFGTEALRHLNATARWLDVKVTKYKMPNPAHFGQTLQIVPDSKAAAFDAKQVKIMVKAKAAATTNDDELPNVKRWENLNKQPKNQRLLLLKALLTHVKVQLNSANAQFRFLVEDVFNGKFEESYPHFFMCLYAIDGLTRKFTRSDQTTEDHLEHLIEVNHGLTQEVQTFIERGHLLIQKIVELRDMLQLAFHYLEEEYTLNIAGFMPSTVELFPEDPIETNQWCLSCCGRQKKSNLNASQFFHTQYREILTTQLIRTKDPEGALILKMSSPSQEAISIRFADEDQESLHTVAERTSPTMLEPPAGVGTVWDNIENATATELHKQVLAIN